MKILTVNTLQGARPPPPKIAKAKLFNTIFSSRYCFFVAEFFSTLDSLIIFLARSARKRKYINSKVPQRRRPAKIPSFECISAFTVYHIFRFRFLNDVKWSPLLCVNAYINYRQTLWRRIRAVWSGSAMFATRTLNGLADYIGIMNLKICLYALCAR